jgi:hypothetical protein
MLLKFCPMLLLLAMVEALRSSAQCETRDGDCPKCSHPWLSGFSPVVKVTLSDTSLISAATTTDSYLQQLDSAHVQRFDNATTGLHTSLFYFCCHSFKEISRMKQALRAMRWRSFVIQYDSFSCNLDHDNKTVYLHALPSNQTMLFAWATHVENQMALFNVTVNHPRRSLFHMTLARVDPVYPVDTAVHHLNNTYFGSHRLCNFIFQGETFVAQDC